MAILASLYTLLLQIYALYAVFNAFTSARVPVVVTSSNTPQVAKSATPSSKSASQAREITSASVSSPAPLSQAASPKPSSTEVGSSTGNSFLRNPTTGETAAMPSSYRFAKKWVKEAIISEGLLDRTYKNAELQGDTADKVKAALDAFKNLPMYQA